MAKQRSIAFFEIIEQIDGGTREFATPLDWETAVRGLEKMSLDDRGADLDRRTIGGPIGIDGTAHLLLHKVRDDTDWTSRADYSRGTIEELIAGANEGYLDTSIFCFVPGTNRIALMRGGQAAPTHVTLRDWLNKMALFGPTQFDVQPLVEQAKLQDVRQADAAQRVDMRLRGLRDRFQRPRGAIARAVKELDQYGEDVSVTLSISMGNSRSRPDGSGDPREALLRDIQEVESALTEEDRASVGLLFQDGDRYTKQQVVALLEHDLTVSVSLPEATDMRHIYGAARLVLTQVDAIRDDLDRAVVRIA